MAGSQNTPLATTSRSNLVAARVRAGGGRAPSRPSRRLADVTSVLQAQEPVDAELCAAYAAR